MTELLRFPTNGVELEVAIAGHGPTVVLLHGFPHTWQVWTDVIPALAPHHRVLAPDLRGFGDSTRTPDGLDAATLATDIEGLLEGRPATVVAIDAGVPAAVLLALRRPDLGLATAGAVRFSTAAAMASDVSIWSSTVSPLDQRLGQE